MDTESKRTIEFLETLADSELELAEFASKLQSQLGAFEDTESKHIAKFLEALAGSRLELAELAHKLESRPDVIGALYSLECSKYRRLSPECFNYQTYVALEGYVDVELRNGKGIAWWLEIHWNDERWVIESRVLLNDNRGQNAQEVIREFSDRTAETLDKCIEQLSQAISDLISSTDSIIESMADKPVC
jgi:hypothetical protein